MVEVWAAEGKLTAQMHSHLLARLGAREGMLPPLPWDSDLALRKNSEPLLGAPNGVFSYLSAWILLT